MTQPGLEQAPQPGWWVRSDYSGANLTAGFGWSANVVGSTVMSGHTTGAYQFATADTIGHTPVPPVFSALAGGSGGSLASSTSFSMTAGLGDYVVIPVCINGNLGTVASVTYGSISLSQVALQFTNNSSANGLYAFWGGYNTSLTGAQTVTATATAGVNAISADGVSYSGVNSVGTPQYVFGNGTSLSQSATCVTSQIIVQGFGHNGTTSFSLPSGGTNRVLNTQGNAKQCVSDTSATPATNTTFTATAGANTWAGIALTLSG